MLSKPGTERRPAPVSEEKKGAFLELLGGILGAGFNSAAS